LFIGKHLITNITVIKRPPEAKTRKFLYLQKKERLFLLEVSFLTGHIFISGITEFNP
jgi:hypothetical protein